MFLKYNNPFYILSSEFIEEIHMTLVGTVFVTIVDTLSVTFIIISSHNY